MKPQSDFLWELEGMEFMQEVTGGGEKQDRGKRTSHKPLKGTVGRTRLQIFSFHVPRRSEFHCLTGYTDDIY